MWRTEAQPGQVTQPEVLSEKGSYAVHVPCFGWNLKFSLLFAEMASSKPPTPTSKPDDTAPTTTFCSSQLRDWSEKGFWVSSLLNWGKSCVSRHHCRSGKAQKILTARTWTLGKQPHFSPKKRWIHRVDLATAEGTCAMGTAEAKCVMGKSWRIQPRTRICKLRPN